MKPMIAPIEARVFDSLLGLEMVQPWLVVEPVLGLTGVGRLGVVSRC